MAIDRSSEHYMYSTLFFTLRSESVREGAHRLPSLLRSIPFADVAVVNLGYSQRVLPFSVCMLKDVNYGKHTTMEF
jgi:hypothetical protein